MNRNRKLSEKTYGKRHVQQHQSRAYATKKKKRFMSNDLKLKLRRI